MPDPVIRAAREGDLAAVLELYGQLHPADPPVPEPLAAESFERIIATTGLTIFLLELDGRAVATTYLNVIPNLTRSAAPYAVIENVVVEASLRGTGLGRQIMVATLEAAWAAGCYKAMLMTGSRRPATHAFYRSCGFDPTAKFAFLARPDAPER